MRTQLVVRAIAISLAVIGCSEAKDPIPSRPDVVARTVSQELTIQQLSKLLGETKLKVEVTPENGLIVANTWSDYQRMGYAAAHNDTLFSRLDVAVTPTYNNQRVNQLLEGLERSMKKDTATQALYDSASHGLYSVRHILFAFPKGASPIQRDSVRREAQMTAMKVNASNFADMARKYSADKQTAAQGGYLGVFPKQMMNPGAAAVVATLKPDSVSKLVQTQFGFDLVQRVSWADAKAQFIPAFSQVSKQARDSTVSEAMADSVNLKLTDIAMAASRDAMLNPPKSRRDTMTVLATFDKGGKFTVADLVAWVNIMPAAQRAQVVKGIGQVPDSLATTFVRNLAMRAVLVRAADRAKIEVPDSLKRVLREEFRTGVIQIWKQLGVLPEQLSDSAKTPAEREQLAARRVNRVIERGMAGQVQVAPIPLPIQAALDAKYPTVVSNAAIVRSLEPAVEMRRAADSLKAANTVAPDGPPAPKTPAPKTPAPKTSAPKTPAPAKDAPTKTEPN